MNRFGRRTFGAALGAGALSLGLGVEAQVAPPRRMVFVITGFGTIWPRFRIRVPGLAEDSDFSFELGGLAESEFSEILAPFHSLREKLTIVEGLSQLTTGFGDTNAIAIGHAPSVASTMTGAAWRVPEADVARPVGDRGCISLGPSIDQIIAREGETAAGGIRSIELGRSFMAAEDGSRLPAAETPQDLYSRLFEGRSVGAEPDPAVEGRRRALALARRQLDSVLGGVAPADRDRLVAHRGMMQRLDGELEALGRPLACTVPPAPEGSGPAPFFDLVHAALACDLTRVVSFGIERPSPTAFGEPAGTNIHQDLAHRENNDASNAASQGMAKLYRWYADHIARFARRLDETPEPSDPSRSMLDQTTVVWMTEQQDGEHAYQNVPYVLIGGCGGRIRTGRYVRYAPRYTLTRAERNRSYGPAHNHALVTLAQAMGLSRDSVGMTECVDSAGRRVDMRGALPELLV